MSKWLIIVPLAVVAILGLLSTLGLGATLDGIAYDIDTGDQQPSIYYDSGGHALMWSNFTEIGEKGKVFSSGDYAIWSGNGTNVWFADINWYPMYWDTSGQVQLLFKDLGKTAPSGVGVSFSFTSGLGFLALLIGISAIAVVAGLRVFGSGTSETAVKLLTIGAGLMALFGVFSFLASALLFESWLGTIAYFFLTMIYTLGIILSVGGGGGDL